jgi:hypothetical protein
VKLKYLSDDGQEFETEEACKAHEDSIWHHPLIGLTEDQVAAMINGTDAKLQRTLFDAYLEAQKIRREKGLVRPRKTAVAAATEPVRP